MNMKLKPLSDRIIVQLASVKKVTEGGLYIPETAQKKTTEGEIYAVGEDIVGLAVGDQVIYDKFAGSPVEFNGNSYLILRYDDILVKVEKA